MIKVSDLACSILTDSQSRTYRCQDSFPTSAGGSVLWQLRCAKCVSTAALCSTVLRSSWRSPRPDSLLGWEEDLPHQSPLPTPWPVLHLRLILCTFGASCWAPFHFKPLVEAEFMEMYFRTFHTCTLQSQRSVNHPVLYFVSVWLLHFVSDKIAVV